MNAPRKDIEGKVRDLLHSFGLTYSVSTREERNLDIDNALKRILSLTTKAELDEKEVVYVLNDRDSLGRKIHELPPEAIANKLCSHFSKPSVPSVGTIKSELLSTLLKSCILGEEIQIDSQEYRILNKLAFCQAQAIHNLLTERMV